MGKTRVRLFTKEQVAEYRRSLGMTQEQFEAAYGIPLGTLRHWEQGVSLPTITPEKLRVFNEIVAWVAKPQRQYSD